MNASALAAGAFVLGASALSGTTPVSGSHVAVAAMSHARAVAPGHGHRPSGLPTPSACSGGYNYNSFIGLDNNSYAGSYGTAILGGASNQVCDQNAGIGTGSDNAIGGGDGPSFIAGGVDNGVTGGYDFIGAGFGNTTSQDGSSVGAGFYNAAAGSGSFVGAGGATYAYVQSYGASAYGNLVLGTDSFVGAGDLNQISGNGSFIGAGGYTVAYAGATTAGNHIAAVDSFVGAGDSNNIAKSATNSAIAAGTSNAADAPLAFVGGGQSNAIENTGGSDSGEYGVIGGGYENSIDPLFARGGKYGVVAGGISNSVLGIAASIGGGAAGKASGEYATIPGGWLNEANGAGSFAAGIRAEALHDGAFVWSDGAGTLALKSTAPDQFLARASGGFYLYSNAALSVGVKLAAGSGAWSSLSDRAAKTRIVPLDDAAVLAKLDHLPLSSWSYRTENPRVRHVGPMAQDFYGAFGVGEDNRHITSIDEDGVALSAIKALHSENVALRERLARDEARLANSDARFAALNRAVSALVKCRETGLPKIPTNVATEAAKAGKGESAWRGRIQAWKRHCRRAVSSTSFWWAPAS